jgi:hypothetical protein
VSRASVQTVRLGLEGMHDGVVRLSGGEHRAVLEVAGGASLLESDQRQEAILAGFAVFLNALTFPIQIVVRAAPVDLLRYVAALEERARQNLPGVLASLAHDHATFVQSLAQQRTLLERRFYVVVPAEPGRRVGWARWLNRRSGATLAADEEAARRQLTYRCDEVAYQLTRSGLHVRRLGDLELAQLFMTCWAPERGRTQRFRQQLEDYLTLTVRGSASTLTLSS